MNMGLFKKTTMEGTLKFKIMLGEVFLKNIVNGRWIWILERHPPPPTPRHFFSGRALADFILSIELVRGFKHSWSRPPVYIHFFIYTHPHISPFWNPYPTLLTPPCSMWQKWGSVSKYKYMEKLGDMLKWKYHLQACEKVAFPEVPQFVKLFELFKKHKFSIKLSWHFYYIAFR